MDTQRTGGQPGDKLSVIVVDENLWHANTARHMLSKHGFQVIVYLSPVEALNFLKDHDIDFGLVALNMKEMHGFQFLGISRELHKDLQVIMMSVDMTWTMMKTCVDLGARFLVKKPLDTSTVNNLWQHLNLKFARMEKIKDLFRGIEGNPHNACCLGYENSAYECGDGIKQKTNLMWTPYLESKFVCALDLLGEGATPKKIQMVMNIKSIKRKNISTHLQKHRKKIEKKLCNKNRKMRNRDSSSSQPLRTCETSPNTLESDDTNMEPIVITDNEMTSDQTESFTEETEGNKIYYEAMQRALRLGAVFDELQHCNDQTESYTEVIDHTFGGINVVVSEESLNTVDDAREVMSKVTNSYEQVSDDSGETGVVKLVAYSDSEDDEIDP